MNDLTNLIEWIEFAHDKKTVLEVLTILNNRHRDAVAAVKAERDQLSRDLSSLLAADCLNGHDATEGAQNGIAMRKALEEAYKTLTDVENRGREFDEGQCPYALTSYLQSVASAALSKLKAFRPIPETTSLQS